MSYKLYYGETFREGGFWNTDGDKVFFDLKRKEEAIVMTLKDEEFNKLIIGCKTPGRNCSNHSKGARQ